MKNGKIIVIITAVIITVGGGCFYAGMKYQQSKTSQDRFNNFRQGQARQFAQRQGFRPVNGEIISADDKSITVKLADNSSRIIFLTDTTVINKSSAGSKDDLKTGEKVVVFGIENSDGSINAQNIQINPVFRRTNNQPK